MAFYAIKPKAKRAARGPAECDPKFKWAWRNARFLVPFIEGGGSFVANTQTCVDLIRGARLSVVGGTPTWASTPEGTAVAFDGSTAYLEYDRFPSQEPSKMLTACCVCRCTLDDNSGRPVFERGDGSSNISWGIVVLDGASDNKVRINLWDGVSGTDVADSVDLPDFVAGTDSVRLILVQTYDGANSRLYCNGRQVATMAKTYAIGYEVGGDRCIIVAGHAGSGGFKGKVSLCYLAETCWSAEQVARWSADPFGFIRPKSVSVKGGAAATAGPLINSQRLKSKLMGLVS